MQLPKTEGKIISTSDVSEISEALRQLDYSWAKQLSKIMYGNDSYQSVQKIRNIVNDINRNNASKRDFVTHGLKLLKELIEKSESAKLSIEMAKDQEALKRLHSRGVIPEECYKIIEQKIKKIKS